MADPVEEFEQYRDELLQALGGRDPIAVIRENLEVLNQIAGDHTDEDLRRAPAPGEWSALDTIQHLIDTKLVYGMRVPE